MVFRSTNSCNSDENDNFAHEKLWWNHHNFCKYEFWVAVWMICALLKPFNFIWNMEMNRRTGNRHRKLFELERIKIIDKYFRPITLLITIESVSVIYKTVKALELFPDIGKRGISTKKKKTRDIWRNFDYIDN